MGRRLKGAALRAKKRGDQAAKELVETTASTVEREQFSNQTNEELFVLDTTAILPSKKQQRKKEAKKQNMQPPSVKEQNQIQALVEKYSPKKLQKMAQQGKLQQEQRRRGLKKDVQHGTFDLWQADDADNDNSDKKDKTPTKKRKRANDERLDPGVGGSLAGTASITTATKTSESKTKPALKPQGKSISIDLAKSGQSYNPDEKAHEKVLQEAVEIELKRNKAEEELKAPISTGMSEETRALLVADSSSDEDDSDDDTDDKLEPSSTKKLIEKQKEKLTRAQRNKQKRLRAEQHEIQERKRQKRFNNTVGEAKTITKQMRKEEMQRRQEKERIETLKEQKKRVRGKDSLLQFANENPIAVPTLPVALPSELKQEQQGAVSSTSLRSIKPKGSLITDRMTSFYDRDMATKKQIKKKFRVQGKRRKAKLKVRGKGHDVSKVGAILG